MRDNFQIAKEFILSSYVFDWAHKAEKLVPFADAEGGYHQPAEWISFIGLGDESCFCCCTSKFLNLSSFTHKFSVRKVNGRLYINSCCSCYEFLHFTYNNINYDDIPAYLFEAIGYKLALISSFRLAENLQIEQILEKRLLSVLGNAEQFEGFNHKPLQGEDVFSFPFDGFNSVF